MGKETQKSAFARLHHITIVVKDLEKAIKFYESVGIGPFVIHPSFKDVRFDEKPGFYKMVKIAKMGEIELQLVQPNKQEGLQKTFLEQKGEGVEHIGFVVEDVDKEERKLKGLGVPILESKREANGFGYTFFDTSSTAGVTLLIRQNPKK